MKYYWGRSSTSIAATLLYKNIWEQDILLYYFFKQRGFHWIENIYIYYTHTQRYSMSTSLFLETDIFWIFLHIASMNRFIHSDFILQSRVYIFLWLSHSKACVAFWIVLNLPHTHTHQERYNLCITTNWGGRGEFRMHKTN